VKELLSNVGSGGGAPVAAGGAPAAGGGGAAAAAAEEEKPKEEEKEESDDDMVSYCLSGIHGLTLTLLFRASVSSTKRSSVFRCPLPLSIAGSSSALYPLLLCIVCLRNRPNMSV
jgi:hypothetical protein